MKNLGLRQLLAMLFFALSGYFATFDQQLLRQQIQEYNTAIANSVQRHHVILVDLTQQGYNLQNHPEYISDDGLHLTDTGYQQLAKLFYDALKMT